MLWPKYLYTLYSALYRAFCCMVYDLSSVYNGAKGAESFRPIKVVDFLYKFFRIKKGQKLSAGQRVSRATPIKPLLSFSVTSVSFLNVVTQFNIGTYKKK